MRKLIDEPAGLVIKDAFKVFGVDPWDNVLFYAIADAIDAEENKLRAENAELRDFCERLNELADACEEVDLFGHSYMTLPLDTDRKPIRVDDVVISSSRKVPKDVPLDVVGVNHIQVFVTYKDEKGEFHEARVFADTCRRYQPPTTEKVLHEFAKDIAELLGGDDFLLDDNDELYGEYAERLQLREEE